MSRPYTHTHLLQHGNATLWDTLKPLPPKKVVQRRQQEENEQGDTRIRTHLMHPAQHHQPARNLRATCASSLSPTSSSCLSFNQVK